MRRPGEGFNAFCRRVGSPALVELLSAGKEPAKGGEDVAVNVPESDGPVF